MTKLNIFIPLFTLLLFYGKLKMILTVVEFKNAKERYVDEYRLREYQKAKANGTKEQNNWSTAGKRIDLIIKMLDFLGDIETLDGTPMSTEAPYIINIGEVAEMVMTEAFNRLNGYGKSTKLRVAGGTSDIHGRGDNAYEVKYEYNAKYRCTALSRDSNAKYVYFMTSKAVYKIPYQIALESEEVYGSNPDKYRHICLDNIESPEQYILKTYTDALYDGKLPKEKKSTK